MKKNYIIPAIETLEVRSTYAICGGSPNDSIKEDTGSLFGAPKKVF